LSESQDGLGHLNCSFWTMILNQPPNQQIGMAEHYINVPCP
jgi:hypothetical protein